MNVPSLGNLFAGTGNGGMQMKGQDAINQGELDAVEAPNMTEMGDGQEVAKQFETKHGTIQNAKSTRVCQIEDFHLTIQTSGFLLYLKTGHCVVAVVVYPLFFFFEAILVVVVVTFIGIHIISIVLFSFFSIVWLRFNIFFF
jgi:hypothetical protein